MQVARFVAGARIAAQGLARGLALPSSRAGTASYRGCARALSQGWIELRQLRVEFVEQLRKVLAALFELLHQIAREPACARSAHARPIPDWNREWTAHAIAIEQLCGAMLQQREAATRQHHRHAPEQTLIQHLRLRHVGQLGGAADIGDGGQQIILHHGPQQRVAAKAARRARPVRRWCRRGPSKRNRRFAAAGKACRFSSSRKNSDVCAST